MSHLHQPWIYQLTSLRALKTSGVELLREDYDALCAESSARAEAHRTAMEEAEVEVADLVGLEVEDLLPGMALDEFGGKRRRGYYEGPKLGDWSQGPVKAG